MKEYPLSFVVNGVARSLSLPARTMLGDALRDFLNLTGTHLGCEHGVCGACTVFVDEKPVRSCITLALSCEGSSIVTIEGLVGHESEIVKAAFNEEHALQCGFCTPGMLVSAVDLIKRFSHLQESEIREAMAGNLCRCTGYAGIVKAIQKAFERNLD